MPNWDVFKPEAIKGRVATTMRVSLNHRGTLTLNQLAFDALHQPNTVELLFDKESRLIGLRVPTEKVPHAYKVRKQGKNKSYLVGLTAFTTHYKIDVTETLTFPDIAISADGVMMLDLNKAVKVEPRAKKS